ncbi:MAG TPA: 16S rRNA (adenine(1518)-N(6)/adenine(1519)-N(6))-dimethyltransferase RsmA [Gemmatimonadaceae bacterium]|nr:16S rRNA (adenine(1518)-N(6)/adenine(1519)-N(6))-dimethyltransferase RsmA [Gemmatimonadaceae bacterium]
MPRESRSARGLPPVRKSLGQHFLEDRRILERIVDALDPKPGDTVIEIGSGRGSLSDILAPRVGRLVLIEYDRALAARLRERYAGTPSVSVVEADVLEVSLARLVDGPFKLIGNVPYYITTPILFHALQAPRAARTVLLVQREVADRIAAEPGSKTYGALSVNVQAVATAKVAFRVAPGSFNPPPKVESAVVVIEPRTDPVVTSSEEDSFRRFVQDAFSMRRKQMRRVVRAIASLDAEKADESLARASIDPTARPETLSPADFARLRRELFSRDS